MSGIRGVDVAEHELGVLFVHGIGSQRRGQTLEQFGGALRTWLCGWLRQPGSPPCRGAAVAGQTPAPPAEFTAARLSPPPDVPAHAELTLRTPDEHTWLLAESWWAEEFEPPSFAELVRWAGDIASWAAASHVAARVRRARRALSRDGLEGVRGWGALQRLVIELVLFVVAALLTPVFLAVLLLVLLIGLIPYKRVRQAAAGLQRGLARSIGDSVALLERPLQGAAIVGRVRADLAWLSQRCDRIAVVAHSQGAAVAHDAIRREARDNLALFVTFGSGLNKLSEIRWLQRQPLRQRLEPLLFTVGIVVSGVAVYLQRGDLARSGAAVLVAIGSLVLGGLAAAAVLRRGRSRPSADGPADDAAGTAEPVPMRRRIRAAVALVVVVTAVSAVAGAFDLDVRFGEVLFLVGLALTVEGARKVAVGHRRDPATARAEFKLPGAAVWLDLYASSDPVPNGPLLDDPPPGLLTDREIHNLGSVTRDHSAYWDNADGFVSRVAEALAGVVGLKLNDGWDRDRLAFARRRRRWRVRQLVTARLLVTLGALVVIVRHWDDQLYVGHRIAHAIAAVINLVPGIELAVGAQPVWQRRLLSLAAILAAAAIVSRLVRAVWEWWDRIDIARLVERRDPRLTDSGMTVYAATVVVLAEGVLFAALGWLVEIRAAWFPAVAVAFVVAVALALARVVSPAARRTGIDGAALMRHLLRRWVGWTLVLLPVAVAGRAGRPTAEGSEVFSAADAWLVLPLLVVAALVVLRTRGVGARIRRWAARRTGSEPVSVKAARAGDVSAARRRVTELRGEPGDEAAGDVTHEAAQEVAQEVVLLAEAAPEAVPEGMLAAATAQLRRSDARQP